MSGFTTVGQVLSLIGMAPVQHANTVVTEGKRAAKSLFPRKDVSALLGVIANGGVNLLLRNPMAVLTAQLQPAMAEVLQSVPQTVTDATTKLVSANPQFTALTGLSNAVTAISQASDMLSGLQVPGPDQYGLMDVLGHIQIGTLLGGLPAQYSMTAVLGPLNAQPSLQNALTFLGGGDGIPVDGNSLDRNAIASHTNDLSAIVTASNAALSGMHDAIALMSNVAVAIGTLNDPNASPDALSFLATVGQIERLTSGVI